MNTQLQGKVVCVALNDSQQLEKMQSVFETAPYNHLPTQPVLYFKPHNTWNNNHIPIPWINGESLVVGASVALIIGKTCCRVKASDAFDYISSYSILHDFSLPEISYYRPDIKGKCLDSTATIGNSVSLSELGNLQEQVLTMSVNNAPVLNFPIFQLSRSAEQLIEDISHIMTLNVGDIIAIGFSGDRIMLKPGDVVYSNLGEKVYLESKVEEINQ